MYSSTSVFLGVIVFVSCAQISLALIGDRCVNNRCPDNEEGASCLDGFCSCSSDSIISDDRRKCLRVATTVGAGCEVDAQCTQQLSFYATCNMDYHQCQCKPEATVVGNRCDRKRLLNEQCTAHQECQHIPQAICDLNSRLCICNQQYVPAANNSVCLPLAITWTSVCEEDIQCSTGFGDNAMCRDMKCMCKESYHPGASSTGPGPVSPVKDTCIPNKGLSDKCDRKDQCYLPRDGDRQNVDCIMGLCKCADNKTPSKDNQSCNGATTLAVFSLIWAVVLALTTTRC